MIENLAGTVNTVAVTTSNQRTVAQAAAPLIRGSARFSDVYDQFHSQPSPARPASTEGRPEQDGQEGNDRESTGALVDGTSTAEGGMATASASDGSDAKLGQKQSDHRVRDAQSASSSSKYGRSDQNPAVESDTASTDITSPLLTAQAPAKGDVDADATEKDRGDQKADDDDANEIASSVIQTFIGSLFIGGPSLSGPQNIGPADQKAGVAHSASIDGKAAQDTLLRDLSGGTVEQPLPAANASGLATPLVDSQSGLPLVDPPSLNAGMGTQVGLADASTNPALASPAVTSTASVSSVVSDVSGNAEAPSYGGALAPSVTVNADLTGLDVNVVSGISVRPASGTDRISTTDPSNDDRGNIDLNTYLSQNWVSGQGVNSQTDKLSGMSQAQTTAVAPATFPQVQKSAGKEGVGVSSVNGAEDKKLESPDVFSPLGIAASEQMAQQTQDQSEEQSSGNSDHRASEPSRPAATEDGMQPSQSLSFEQQVAQSSQNIGYQDTGVASTKNGAGKSPKADAPYAASNANPVSRLSVRSEGTGGDGRTLSMTVKTANSSEVRIKVTNDNDGTSRVMLESENEATSHELKKSHADLVRALEAAGVNTSHMKIEVTASNSTNSDPNGSGAGSDQQNMMDWDGQGFFGGGQSNQRNSPPKNIPSNPVGDCPILSEAPSGPATLNAGSSGINGLTNSGLNITV